MHTHRFPQPMWNATEQEIVFDQRMSEQLTVKTCAPGDIVYVPNEIVYRQLTNDGRSQAWSTKALYREYPKVLHGPDWQSVTVNNPEEEEAAFANGWMLKPQVEEVATELPVSPFRAPKPAKGMIAVEEPARRGPGRPKAS